MFFGFQLTCGLMLVFYGYSVMKNPRVWGDQGRQAVKAENFPEYCRHHINRHLRVVHLDVGKGTYQTGQVDAVHVHK